MNDVYAGVTDNRLSEKDFSQKFAKYGEIGAMSLWGARWVGSAILVKGRRKTYVRFDHTTGDYVRED